MSKPVETVEKGRRRGIVSYASAVWKTLGLVIVGLAGCSRPLPITEARSVSPDGKLEITLWHEQAAGTLDSTMLFTIDRPHTAFSSDRLRAGVKRGRDVESYWTADGRAVFSAREFSGWLRSENNSISFVVCGLPVQDCKRLLPPADDRKVLRLGTYHSGESESF